MLASDLEAEGWSVWWDRHLKAGDIYRDEIMRELAVARATIVVWTPASIKSEFVRAEAGYSKAQAKLIPVKDPSLAYGDIPLPFGEMHTENLSSRVLIRGAIVALLAKPKVEASGWWISTRILRSEFLTWAALVCSAVTIFSALQSVLQLSAMARWVTEHWHAWTIMLWEIALGWTGIKVPAVIAPLLSFFVFALVMAIGVRLRQGPPVLRWRQPRREDVLEWAATSSFMLSLFLGVAYVLFWEVLTFSHFIPLLVIIGFNGVSELFFEQDLFGTADDYLFLALFIALALVLVGPRLLFPDISYATSQTPDAKSARDLLVSINPFFSIFVFCPFIMTRIAPVRGLAKRLAFSVIGVALLAGLNKVAVHTADIRAFFTFS